MKKVFVLTDSLGAPRKPPGFVKYEDTYTFKLKKCFEKRDCDVFLLTKSGLNSTEVKNFLNYNLELYGPNLLILHFGIVDCAPRAFKELEIKTANFFRVGRILRFIGRKYHKRLTALRKIKTTSEKDFENNLLEIKQLCENLKVKIIVIPIMKACEGYKEKSKGIENAISSYNEILRKNFNLLDVNYSSLDDTLDSLYISDFHHLSFDGHQFLFNEILRNLENSINK